MKHTIVPATFAILLATAFVSGIVPGAQAGEDKQCSKAAIEGGYGYTSTGTLLDSYVPPPLAGPFAEVGRQTFDGKGNTEGTATLSTNGNTATVTIKGTYVVNADCTGSMTLNVAPLGAVVHTSFVIDDDGAQLRAIVTDSGLIESRVYQSQFRSGHREW